MKHLQHISKTSETLETYFCNMRFQRNISLLLRRMEARRYVEFTGVELAAPVEKAVADLARAVTAPVEKAVRALEKAATGRRCDGDTGR